VFRFRSAIIANNDLFKYAAHCNQHSNGKPTRNRKLPSSANRVHRR
jgi:hypothetical protein